MSRHDVQPVREARRSFYLDRQKGALWGVCAGIANYFGIGAGWVRAGFVAGTLLGFGSFILIYIVIALVAD